jgi:hypothetical protein
MFLFVVLVRLHVVTRTYRCMHVNVEVIYRRSYILLASKRAGLPIGCKTSDINLNG